MGSQNHLTALPLELHIHIFSNLQPYDILQVRQTCRALYLASSERTVWMDALHRICVENTLFKPSFHVASMSVLALQRASMGPHRWIARSSSKKRNSDGVLPHSVIRQLPIDLGPGTLGHPYLVPGGRYLFSISSDWLALWDLGSPYSSGREPHIVVSVPVEVYGDYLVHSAPDGMGLRVFLPYQVDDDPEDMASLYIYEIYPESTSPQLTQIAHRRIPLGSHFDNLYSLSCDRLIFAHGDALTVWDYNANTWARWGIEPSICRVKIATTNSAVALIHTYGVSVWEIPPLLPESSLSMSTVPLVMSPVFELHFPKNHFYDHVHQAPSDWYSDSLEPLSYDMIEKQYADPPKINHLEVPPINSKVFGGGTLYWLNTFEVRLDYHFMGARICQDKIVSIYGDRCTYFLGTRVIDIYDQQIPAFLAPLCHDPISSISATFCPVTGRVVYCDTHSRSPPSIIVLEF